MLTVRRTLPRGQSRIVSCLRGDDVSGQRFSMSLGTYIGHIIIARPRIEAGPYSARYRGMLNDIVADATPASKRSRRRAANPGRSQYRKLFRKIARHALTMARDDAVQRARRRPMLLLRSAASGCSSNGIATSRTLSRRY